MQVNTLKAWLAFAVLASPVAFASGLVLGNHLGLSLALRHSLVLEPDFAVKVLTDADQGINQAAYTAWLRGVEGKACYKDGKS